MQSQPHPHRVLVTCCSSGAGQEIYRSLDHRPDVELYGLDERDDAPGRSLFRCRFYSGCPPASDEPGLVEFLVDFCAVHRISFVFPGSGDCTLALKRIEPLIGARVVTSPLETCAVSRSRRLTLERLGAVVRVAGLGPERAVEIGVDCLTGPGGELLFHCPRVEDEGGSGDDSAVTARVEDARVLEEARGMAERINGSMRFVGAWFFRARASRALGQLTLLEITPRTAGSSRFSRLSGVNLPLLSLGIAIGLPVPARIEASEIPARVTRVTRALVDPPIRFKNLYVGLHDTLLLNGEANPEAMACLYRCVGSGVPVHLVTRTPLDVRAVLSRFRIPFELFASVRRVSGNASKGEHVLPDSVVVDASSRDREDCSSGERNVRCFDVDAFEFL